MGGVMVKRKQPAPTPQLEPEDKLALSVATGYVRQAAISLAAVEHAHPARARQEFEKLAEAKALLGGALEIVEAHMTDRAGKL
jgi:hypothetical protein